MPNPLRQSLGRALRRREGAAVDATYAAVLDGAHLWLDVEGPVSVRDVDTGEVTDLGAEPYDLGALTGSTYDVLAGQAGVELADRSADPLTRTPLAPDGVTRWEVVRRDDGRLQLRRRTEPATAELDAVDERDGRIHLRIRPVDAVEPGCHLLLLDTDDQTLATLPATAHEGLVETLIGVDDLPAGYFGVLRVALGTEDGWVRVRRRANDLADPNRAVLLPELYADPADDGQPPEHPRARLRWNPDGLLALRSIDPEAG
ncbi:MAG TPA: hypothetical protein PK324_20100 [Nocardioides sp.]|uniref:hypothetical protein n=1 Tax=uncultured Nocardioides sp. TaxID=198441 RepID=UPI00261B3903|nr:hypothetical protein [uncultured Nocardioides sp.]HRK47945.1 hypothetical protein [Nocardioides sp.]